MLERVTAVEYVGAPSNGRTKPAHVVCEKADGTPLELIAKVSGACEEGVINLAREVVAACLARDLELPIPQPYLIDIPPEFLDIIPDTERQHLFRESVSVAFGSTFVTQQFGTWSAGNRVTETMLPTAAAIFAFDAIIQNPDRRSGNSNCVVRGDEFRIFDHELCFAHDQILFWMPPWALGGLNSMTTPGNHIFRAGLIGRKVDWSGITARWQGLSDARLVAYEGAIPVEWAAALPRVAAAVKLIRDARDNIDGCLTEIRRVLT